MSNDRQALAELSAWLLAEANRHATSIAYRDAAVQTHITQLRMWARHVNALASPAGEADQEQPLQPLTNEQREAEFARWNYAPDALLFYRMGPAERTKRTFFDGMAAAERAHGIGQLGDTGTTKDQS